MYLKKLYLFSLYCINKKQAKLFNNCQYFIKITYNLTNFALFNYAEKMRNLQQ